MPIQQTFVILKPDCQERGLIGKIISRFEDKFLRVVRIGSQQKDEDWCRQHYAHLNDEIYEKQKDFMSCAPLIGIILEGPDAIDVVRKMVGKTNSLLAEPGTIRFDYGTYPVRYNIIHAADSEEAVKRERGLFFNE